MPDEPANMLDTDSGKQAAVGVALCLSGGGYRAMLFHLGSLLRLLEIGYLGSQKIPADLGHFERISSVSGGSITSGCLGLNWGRVKPGQDGARDRYFEHVIDPVRRLAGKTIDVSSVAIGFLPGTSASRRIAAKYRKYLFKKQTLDGFPESPRFVINATNLQSGALWRFMRPYTRDWKVGEMPRDRKQIEIAVAVAASSAFPPFLSPAKLKFSESDYTPHSGELQKAPFTTKPILSDGGVYDNLGLETVWKRYRTVLVSDAGGQMSPKGKVPSNWPLQSYRVLNVIDNQVRSLRKRQVIDSYVNGTRTGAYWGIRTNIDNYELDDALPCPYSKTVGLANTPTRLKSLPRKLQDQLINWGYAVCDAALRKHVDDSIRPPEDFPYPDSGVG